MEYMRKCLPTNIRPFKSIIKTLKHIRRPLCMTADTKAVTLSNSSVTYIGNLEQSPRPVASGFGHCVPHRSPSTPHQNVVKSSTYQSENCENPLKNPAVPERTNFYLLYLYFTCRLPTLGYQHRCVRLGGGLRGRGGHFGRRIEVERRKKVLMKKNAPNAYVRFYYVCTAYTCTVLCYL